MKFCELECSATSTMARTEWRTDSILFSSHSTVGPASKMST
ncbi:Uncharacterised protein [Vibrio cholerae]|nr:Uncharacterised protein [Vibrio cholerae]